jgi:hypothetical protein
MRSNVALVAMLSLTACAGSSDMSGPSAPTPVVPTSPAELPTVRLPIALSVGRGTTGGGTPVHVTGDRVARDATVTFGTTTVRTTYDPRHPSSVFVETPAHPAGLIDVTVVNPDGQTFRLSQGYEYVPQGSFDFNGDWVAIVGHGSADGSDMQMQFTVKTNVLVSASCTGSDGATRTVTLSTPVRDGEFSSGPHEGFALTGRILSNFQARGQITAPCGSRNEPWLGLHNH